VTRTAVDRPEVLETTALGIAYAAGLAVGVWSDTDDIREAWRRERRFEPQADADEVDAAYERWTEAVELSRQWK
jgi:glycerol kinase